MSQQTHQHPICETMADSIRTLAGGLAEPMPARLAACDGCPLLGPDGCTDCSRCSNRWNNWRQRITTGRCAGFGEHSTLKAGEKNMPPVTFPTAPGSTGAAFRTKAPLSLARSPRATTRS